MCEKENSQSRKMMLSPRKESTKSCEIMADASAPRSASDCELPTFNTCSLSPISLSQMETRASKQSETLEREKERDGNLNDELGDVSFHTTWTYSKSFGLIM